MSKLYMIYSLMLIGATATASYRGWGLGNYNEVKNVPMSVRNNPGAYRSHYAAFPRYAGGK
jgi:hypothetical protein